MTWQRPRNYEFRNGVESLAVLVNELIEVGNPVAPRGQATLELRNVTITVVDPHDIALTGIGRGWSKKVAGLEAMQLIGGFSVPGQIVKVAPVFARFREDDGTFWGPYGERAGKQLPAAIERLKRDPDTRQAIVALWQPKDGLTDGKRDYPCTLSLTFAVRKGRLLLETHMRSNDVWWGWSYDLFQFAYLQNTVAAYLGLIPGPYVHYVNSLHIYDRDIAAAAECAKRARLKVSANDRRLFNGLLAGPLENWSQVQRRAWDIAREELPSTELANGTVIRRSDEETELCLWRLNTAKGDEQ